MRVLALCLLTACGSTPSRPSNTVTTEKPGVHFTLDLTYQKPFATRPMKITIHAGDRDEVHEVMGAKFRQPVRLQAQYARVGDHYIVEVEGMSRDGCNQIRGAYAGVVETFETVLDPTKNPPGVSRTEMSCVGMDDGSEWD